MTWIDQTSAGTRVWAGITSSADGSKLAAVAYGADIWTYTAAVAVQAPTPPPIQRSNITAISTTHDKSGSGVDITITGTFIEGISNIAVNNVNITQGSWIATDTSVSFMLPTVIKVTSIQLFDGSAPLLNPQLILPDPPVVIAVPSPVKKAKAKYLRCIRPSGSMRIAYGINPVCPTGSSTK